MKLTSFWDNFADSFWNTLTIIWGFFFPPSEEKVKGKLFVSGEGYLEFVFNYCPDNVCIYFDDDVPVPCNPGAEDSLDWIIEAGRKYKLIIKWSVNGARTIIWKVH